MTNPSLERLSRTDSLQRDDRLQPDAAANAKQSAIGALSWASELTFVD